MHALIAHLRKDYRDHRIGLWGLAIVVVVLAGVARYVWPDAGSAGVCHGFLLATMSAVLVLFAPDLVGSEQTRGTLKFVLRVPRGEHLAYWSKTTFLAVILVAFALAAYLTVSLLWAVNGAEWLPLSKTKLEVLLPHALAVGLWLVAVSSWLPRSALAVPATAMMAALILLPGYLLLGGPRLLPYLSWWPLHVAHPVVAGLTAWASFVRGRRFGGGLGSSAWRGGITAAGTCAALTGWVALELDRIDAVDHRQSVPVHDGAFLGADARYVFLNTRRQQGPTAGVVVDLRDRTWQRLGALGERFFSPHDLDRSTIRSTAGYPLLLQTVGAEFLSYIDTSTAREVRRGPIDLPYLDQIDSGRAAARASTPLRMPDGRRVWVFRRALEVEDGEGFTELPWDERDTAAQPMGFGILVHGGGKRRVYDLARLRRFDPPGTRDTSCWVLPAAWLLGDRERVRRTTTWHSWRLHDPLTGNEHPAPGLRDGDEVMTLLDDARALVVGGTRQADDVWAVDLGTGNRTRVALPGVQTTDRQHISSLRDPARVPAHTADGRRILYCAVIGQPASLTSFVAEAERLTTPVPGFRLVGSDRGHSALVIHCGALERVDLDTGAREQIFPPPE